MSEESINSLKIKNTDNKIDILLDKINETNVWIRDINDKLFDLNNNSIKHDAQLHHFDKIISSMQKSLEVMQTIQRENEKIIIETKLSSEEKVSITSVAAVISTALATIIDKIT